MSWGSWATLPVRRRGTTSGFTIDDLRFTHGGSVWESQTSSDTLFPLLPIADCGLRIADLRGSGDAASGWGGASGWVSASSVFSGRVIKFFRLTNIFFILLSFSMGGRVNLTRLPHLHRMSHFAHLPLRPF